MITCFACGHERLLHDSWGCKRPGCGCKVSIVYLTPPRLTAEQSSDEELEVLDEGDRLDAERDRKNERDLKELRRRALVEHHVSWWW